MISAPAERFAAFRERRELSKEALHCVRTATLVAPRVTPPASLKRTNTRLFAGSKGTDVLPVTKIAKVGVSFVLIGRVTVAPSADMHTPVTGSVRQRRMLIGSIALTV